MKTIRIALIVISLWTAGFQCSLFAAEPSSEEIYFVELINRARANPLAEAARYGIDLNEGIPASKTISSDPKPPLAINEALVSAALGHSEDMAQQGYFSHYTEGSNASPQQRCIDQGYADYSGENIALNSSTGLLDIDQNIAGYHHQLLFVDQGVTDRGHRTNMMTASHMEVGVGMAKGIYYDGSGTFWPEAVYSTTDFGRGSGSVFLCGVIYNDLNGNGFYDAGEGLSGAIVRVVETGKQVDAWTGGAYSLAVPGPGAPMRSQ
jgi:hypothetical protein